LQGIVFAAAARIVDHGALWGSPQIRERSTPLPRIPRADSSADPRSLPGSRR
jgi:hypothetical protein